MTPPPPALFPAGDCYSCYRPTSSLVGLEREADPQDVRPDILAVKDIGLEQGMVDAVLEAIALGRATFSVRALVEDTAEETTAGGSVTSGPREEETPLQGKKPSGGPASTGAEAASEGKEKASAVQEAKAGAVVSQSGGVLGGGRQGSEDARAAGGWRMRTPVNNFRCTRPIDNDIMGTLVAEVTPMAEPGCAEGAGGAHGSAEDALEVYGPEMEWGSMGDAMEVDDAAMEAVTEALGKTEEEEEGLTLVQLKRTVREAARSVGEPAEEERVRAFIGKMLRNGTIVGMCGAQDARYVVVVLVVYFAWDTSTILVYIYI